MHVSDKMTGEINIMNRKLLASNKFEVRNMLESQLNIS